MRKPGLAIIPAAVLAFVLAMPGSSMAILGDCGQPATNGADPVATDALEVLKTGVGSSNCGGFDLCICDVNSSGTAQAPDVNATDALIDLQKGVGQSVTLTCPCAAPGGANCSAVKVTVLAGSELDSGWTGAGHNSALIAGAGITLANQRRCSVSGNPCGQRDDPACPGGEVCTDLCDCDSTDPTKICSISKTPCNDVGDCNAGIGERCARASECELTGPIHEKRCAFTQVICESDIECTGGALDVCVNFFGPPLPLVAAGVGACVTTFFNSDLTGTADAQTGHSLTDVKLRSRVHLGPNTRPCPECATGGTPEVGDVGTCSGDTANVGLACTVHAVSDDFGGMSSDCPPQPGQNVSGLGLSIIFNGTSTDEVIRDAMLPCADGTVAFHPDLGNGICIDNGTPCTSNADCLRCTDDESVCTSNGDCGNNDCGIAPAHPISCGVQCHCGFCNDNPDEPCFSDDDCTGGDSCVVGTGGQTDANKAQFRPNNCSNLICGAETPDTCASGDTLGECDVLDFVPCTNDQKCINEGAGTTCLFVPRPCLESRIQRQGTPDPLGMQCVDEDPPIDCTTNADCGGSECRADSVAPSAAAAFCIPTTASPAINDAGGITGPGAIEFSVLGEVCRCGDDEADSDCFEDCDGTDDSACPGACSDYCFCP